VFLGGNNKYQGRKTLFFKIQKIFLRSSGLKIVGPKREVQAATIVITLLCAPENLATPVKQ